MTNLGLTNMGVILFGWDGLPCPPPYAVALATSLSLKPGELGESLVPEIAPVSANNASPNLMGLIPGLLLAVLVLGVLGIFGRGAVKLAFAS